jgi:hypothetical protein
MLAPWLQCISSTSKRRKVTSHFKYVEVAAGEKVVSHGQVGANFFAIVRGSMAARLPDLNADALPMARLLPGNFFGEDSWLHGTPCNCDVVAIEPSLLVPARPSNPRALRASAQGCPALPCPTRSAGAVRQATLPHSEMETALGGYSGVRGFLERTSGMRRRLRAYKTNKSNGCSLDALSMVRTVGEGAFSKVKLVTLMRDGKRTSAALKCCSKATVMKMQQLTRIGVERDIVASLDHPFVYKLLATFRDDATLYMLFEAVLGGELFSLLDKHHILPPGATAFYIGCLYLTFQVA